MDEEGLDRLDRAVLDALVRRFGGGPVGLSTLAVAVGEEAETVEVVAEPFLVRRGLLARTPARPGRHPGRLGAPGPHPSRRHHRPRPGHPVRLRAAGDRRRSPCGHDHGLNAVACWWVVDGSLHCGSWPLAAASCGIRVTRLRRGPGLADPLNPTGKVPRAWGSLLAPRRLSRPGGSTFIIFIIVIIGAMYFLVMRPGQKRQQQAQQQQSSVQPGARVRTTAGMYATVVAMDGDDVILEVAPDVEVRYMKRAVMEVIGDATTVDDETDEDGTAKTTRPPTHDEHLEDETYEEHEEAAVPSRELWRGPDRQRLRRTRPRPTATRRSRPRHRRQGMTGASDGSVGND